MRLANGSLSVRARARERWRAARTRGAPQSASSLSTIATSLLQAAKLAPSGWLVSSCTAPAYSYEPLWSAGMQGLAARVSSNASTAARPAISPKPR